MSQINKGGRHGVKEFAYSKIVRRAARIWIRATTNKTKIRREEILLGSPEYVWGRKLEYDVW